MTHRGRRMLDGNATQPQRVAKLEQRRQPTSECTLPLPACCRRTRKAVGSLRRHPFGAWRDWPCVWRLAVRGGCIPARRCKGKGHGKVCQTVLTGFLGVETQAIRDLGGFAPGPRSRHSLTREIGLAHRRCF